MLGKLFKLIFFFVFLPIRLPWNMLFDRNYRDKVGFYSFQKAQYNLNVVESVESGGARPVANVSYPANGGGFLSRRGRFIIETGGGGGATIDQRDQYNIFAGGGEGRISLGFILKGGSGLRIYPMVGIGGGGGGVTVKSGSEETLLNSGIADVTYHVGLGIDFRIGWRLGLIGGLRVGYNTPVIGNTRTPYIRFIAGAGWFGKDKGKSAARAEKEAEDEPEISTESVEDKQAEVIAEPA